MTTNAAVRLMAGTMLGLSLVLAHLVSPWFLLMTAFVGANLTQFSITRFCPAVMIFQKLGLRGECATRQWTVSRGLSLGVGLVVLAAVGVGAALGSLLLTTVVVGVVALSLAQSAFSGWCPMMAIVRAAGLPEGQPG